MNTFELHGGDWHWAGQQFNRPNENWLDFSVNVNPLGPPKSVTEALQQTLVMPMKKSLLTRYPDPQAREAKKVLAQFLNVDEQCLLLTNGGSEAIDLVVRLLNPERVHLIEPCFGEYERAVLAYGGMICRHRTSAEGNFHWHPKTLLQKMGDGDVVIFAQPNNPTGILVSRDEVLHYFEQQRGHTPEGKQTLIVDEAFIDFVPDAEALSFRFKAAQNRNTIVVGSLTKIFALPGLRLGYVIAHPSNIRKMAKLQPTWSVNAFAQVAITRATSDGDYIARTNAWLPSAREQLFQGLSSLRGVHPWQSAANFLLVHVKGTGRTAAEWQRLLAQHGILVRTCASFHGLDPYFLRLAVLLPSENEFLLSVMSQYL